MNYANQKYYIRIVNIDSIWHGGSGACTAASQQEGHEFDSRMGCCWLWGAGPSVLMWAISRAFLCGVCMFSPCSQRVSSTKNPNRKTCKKNRTILSVPDRDG